MNRSQLKENPVVFEDLNEVLEDERLFMKIKNSTILITGVTGLIGSLLFKSLLIYDVRYNAGIKLVALSRNKDKTEKLFKEYNVKNVKFIYQDIADPLSITDRIDFIFHCASMTTSKLFISNPVETILTSVYGTQNVLEIAREKKVRSVVYLSSMEVYGVITDSKDRVAEDKLGDIDVLNVRSSYSESKRMCECLCVSYYKEYGVPVKIARLAQTFGPGILVDDNRVFAQFAKSIIQGNDIVLHTKGESIGNYCYITDALRALFLLLDAGKDGEAYNIVNEESTMTIKEMAELVISNFGGVKSRLVFEIPKQSLGYAPNTQLRMSAAKLNELGWRPKTDLVKSYKRLIEFLTFN